MRPAIHAYKFLQVYCSVYNYCDMIYVHVEMTTYVKTLTYRFNQLLLYNALFIVDHCMNYIYALILL